MGSNVSTTKKPTGGPPLRKSALRNSNKTKENQRPSDTDGDLFGTNAQGAAINSHTDGTFPSPRQDRPGARSRVHYEDDNVVPVNRDGMVLDDPNSVNPWMNDGGTLAAGYKNTYRDVGYEPRGYRPQMRFQGPQQPQQIAGQPLYRHQDPYYYPYRPPAPQHYQYRPRGQRSWARYTQGYRPSGPYEQQYRPAPVDYYERRDQPMAGTRFTQPPPYHSLEHIAYRRNHIPHDQPNPQPKPNPQPNPQSANVDNSMVQDDQLTERNRVQLQENPNGSNVYRETYEVQSLLSPAHQATRLAKGNVSTTRTESSHATDDDEYIGANLRFYRNQMKFRPNGELIDYIHRYWYGNYNLLEKLQTYIQWLFPMYDSSRVNPQAIPLRAHEAKHIHDDAETRDRFITSFMMMLDFYGFILVDEENGQIERAANWNDRFNNLKRSDHNHSRITRILKSLGELGHSKLQCPFVMALFHEVFETQELFGIPPATISHWLRAINDDFEREYVYKQFQTGLTRLEEERKALKLTETGKYYTARCKTGSIRDDNVINTTRKKTRSLQFENLS